MEPSIFFLFCACIVFLILLPTSFANSLCHPDESSALMEFKRSFRTNRTEWRCDYPKVESWSLDGHGDCCSWDGVKCDDATGHVTGLDLNGSCLFGTITSNTSLFRLLHLESLNLAFNDFNSSSIPYGFSNLSKLHYLNLSYSEFSGKVPLDISRLSRLISLDLSRERGLEIPNAENFVRNLTTLRELDLSYISISSPFPHVLANLSSLKSLKLAECLLHGEFPVSIFQLPNLEVLDISENYDLSGFIPELHWGNRLKSLSLSDTNFSGEIPVSIGNLVFLNELSISGCNISGSLPTSLGNLSELTHLDVSGNKFQGQIPASFANLRQLSSLSLYSTNFSGGIWHWLVNLAKLTDLDLGDAQLSGPIPSSFGNLTQLVRLYLSSNNLQGEVPNSLLELKDLKQLFLGGNNLSGTVDLHKMKNLEYLVLDFNNISFVSGAEINATLPKLSYLSLESCNLHEFPKLLGHLSGLESIDLSHNKIGGSIPTWMGNGSRESLRYVDLSHNFLTGFVDSRVNLTQLVQLDLSSNNLQGESLNSLLELKNLEVLYLDFNNITFVSKIEMNATLPKLSYLSLESCNLHEFPKLLGHLSGLASIELSHNKIGGSIPTWMGNGSRESLRYVDLSHNFLTGFGDNRINLLLPKLTYLDISSNSLKTELPTPPPSVAYYNISNNILFGDIQSICRAKSLATLDLSNNSLNGTIPTCLENIHSLAILNLGKNELEGLIPHAFPKGCALKVIELTENRLQGPVPRSLGKCQMLEYLNLGHNQILDGFPIWLSELTNLKFIILKSNNFHGPIKPHQSQFNFSNLHIMDLANNSFNGELPAWLLQSFHAMKVVSPQDQLEYMSTLEWLSGIPRYFDYGMKLMNKGIEREYPKLPYALMGIDLSNNKFEGRILDLIGDLKSLLMLNLSNNVLNGSIPPSLANLSNLESLDLSRNKLSGEIPPQLAQLTFLSYFNVSHNQLSGPIPEGSQFNTFSIDSFAMNEGLCGSPLPKKCTMAGDNLPSPPSPREEIGEESLFNLDWKFVLIGAGVGFLTGMVLGKLIIDEKSKWFLRYSKRMAKGWNRSSRH
ncbi:uncharacterized protein J3R85_008815 [Psidium guajava]|nr:uncharacterized protein J3R85_008815 [Psidium guajava]